jgi:hypothetical protein
MLHSTWPRSASVSWRVASPAQRVKMCSAWESKVLDRYENRCTCTINGYLTLK